LRLRHAAIRYLHLLAGYPPPTAAAVVATTLAGIKRAHRRPVGKKTALVLDRLRAALHTIPETLPGRRDRALLLVGFAAALRPSEIAVLALEHLAYHADGIELYLPRRKNDQDARGTKLWLPKGRTELCPVAALEAWLAAAAISAGPLLRRIWLLPPPRVVKGPNPERPDRHRCDRADRPEMDRAGRVRRGGFCRPQPAPRGDLERVAAGVHIAASSSSSAMPRSKSLEE
jgi:integrase